jgi:cytochrome c-type biogenesis protein CcmH/NrfG
MNQVTPATLVTRNRASRKPMSDDYKNDEFLRRLSAEDPASRLDETHPEVPGDRKAVRAHVTRLLEPRRARTDGRRTRRWWLFAFVLVAAGVVAAGSFAVPTASPGAASGQQAPARAGDQQSAPAPGAVPEPVPPPNLGPNPDSPVVLAASPASDQCQGPGCRGEG